MDKEELLKKYQKEEDWLVIAKLWDKIELCKTKNKLVHTDFLDLYQKSIAEKLVDKVKHIFFGGYDGAERTILIVYPEKLEKEIVENNYSEIFEVVRIELPNDLKGKYQHKNYLGAIMKLGIKREKVGDILVREQGADIIVQKEMAEYIKQELGELTRFSKSVIEILPLQELKESENQKEDFYIMVPSLRLDCIVSELIRSSRTKANEAILSGRVFINSENILKNAKTVKEGDTITVRGKGKFDFLEIEGNTKKGRYILKMQKYV